MVQAGSLLDTSEQSWESYEDMHKHARKLANPSQSATGTFTSHVCHEYFMMLTLASTNAAHEIEQDGGLTIADPGKTELTILLACDTNDNAYDGHYVTGHYITSAGVKTDFTALYDSTATTTEVAICADFYCWNLEDYTPATVLVSSVAVQAGDNVYIGTTGMVAGAEKRYATIAAAATYPAAATLFGVGNVFGAEEADTAGDVGKVITWTYVTPWGTLKEAHFTLAATTTDIVRLDDTTTGYPVMDFYRKRKGKTTAAVGKYVAIAIDADKVVGTVVLDTFYGVIEEGNFESIHSAFFTQKSPRHAYVGKIEFEKSDATTVITVVMTCTYLGDPASHTETWAFNTSQATWDIHRELEPLTECSFTIADDNAAHPNVHMRTAMVEV